jgi:hypothetical protein
LKTFSRRAQSGLETLKESSKLASDSIITYRKMFAHLFTKEKRVELRFPVAIYSSCFEFGSADTVNGETHDISRGGVCLITGTEIPLGTQIEVILKMIDNDETVLKKGIVVWSAMYGDDAHRIGIKLQEPKLKPIPLVLRTIMALSQAHREKKSA